MQVDKIVKAAILTAIVFTAGVAAGIGIESWRLEEIRQQLTETDLIWADARLQQLYYDTFANQSGLCEAAIAANWDFADRIYAEGERLERAEKINRFTPQILLEKRRYALLQLQFWFNGMRLREMCGANYSTIAYFYSWYNETLEIPQMAQSAVLVEKIHACGRRLIVVPLPLDLNISTVNTIAAHYNITAAPALLINERTVLYGPVSVAELERYIKC